MDSGNIELKTKPKKKTTKPKKKICLRCEDEVEIETNKFLCAVHFEQGTDSKKCQGRKSDKTPCTYEASYMGFCGHHIAIPKPEDFVAKEADTSRKIRIQASKEDFNIIKQWFGVGRKIYNMGNIKLKKKLETLSSVRDATVADSNSIDFMKKVPLKIRQGALEDLVKATSNAISKYKETGKRQKVKNRKKTKTSQSIYINRTAIKIQGEKKLSIYTTRLGVLHTDEPIPEIMTHCRLTLKHGRFLYLCIPMEMEKQEIVPESGGIVALDPGERSFQSFYNPLMSGHIGYHTRERIMKPLLESDRIKSKMTKLKATIKRQRHAKARKNIKSRIKWLRKKYFSNISKPTRLVKELHYQTASFLCNHFDTILIPEYKTKEMAPDLPPIVNRSNQALSHYSFRMRLLHTAKRLKKSVHVVSEAFTSRTCTSCGHLNPKSKDPILTCADCHLSMNRDIIGSRNIWIKNVIWFNNHRGALSSVNTSNHDS